MYGIDVLDENRLKDNALHQISGNGKRRESHLTCSYMKKDENGNFTGEKVKSQELVIQEQEEIYKEYI